MWFLFYTTFCSLKISKQFNIRIEWHTNTVVDIKSNYILTIFQMENVLRSFRDNSFKSLGDNIARFLNQLFIFLRTMSDGFERGKEV